MRVRTLSAGVIVLNRAAGSCLFLVLRAYRYWDFPKGLVEPHEDPLTAARREVREETGIERLEFRWGDAHRETEPYGRGKVARYYLAETTQTRVALTVSAERGRPEHHEYRWAPLEEALDLLAPRVQAVLQWAAGVTGCAARPD